MRQRPSRRWLDDALSGPDPRHAGRPVRRRRSSERTTTPASLVSDGAIIESGPFDEVRARHPAETVVDLTGGVLLPGFVDTHVHFPQMRAIGGAGHAAAGLARRVRAAGGGAARPTSATPARRPAFVRALRRRRHDHRARLRVALRAGRRRRCSRPPRDAGCASPAGSSSATGCCATTCTRTRARVRRGSRCSPSDGTAWACCATPSPPGSRCRAPTTCSTSCAALARGRGRQLVHLAHQRESGRDRHRAGAVRRRQLPRQLRQARPGRAAQRVRAQRAPDRTPSSRRLAATGASVAHCPTSNAALGSGLFPLDRHLAAGVPSRAGHVTSAPAPASRCSRRRCRPTSCNGCAGADGVPLTATHLLYLATGAGADALGLRRPDRRSQRRASASTPCGCARSRRRPSTSGCSTPPGRRRAGQDVRPGHRPTWTDLAAVSGRTMRPPGQAA